MSKKAKIFITIIAIILFLLVSLMIVYIINDFIETRTPNDFSLEHGNI